MRRLTEVRAQMRREDGFTMVEIIAAISLLGVGFLALAGTMSSGSRMLVQGKQRQVAAQEASARIDAVRHMPYEDVALRTEPTHNTDPKHPDHWVRTGGGSFDPERDGATYEALLVDTVNGEVTQKEGPFRVASTELTAYQYVTWVDDAAIAGTQDYKRVTVVVTYSAAANPGRPNHVQVTAFVTPGTVTLAGSTGSASQGSGTPSASPTPSPTPSGSCDGDATPPSGTFSIVSASSGAESGYTASQNVTLSLSPSDPCDPITVEMSNDGTSWSAATTFDPAAPTASWTLTAGDGTKNVRVRYTDGAGNAVVVGPQSIVLDGTLPTVPGTLSGTASCSGNNRTVNLSWGVSTDTNLVGYRVYRNVNGEGYTALTTTSSTSVSNTHLKNHNSVAFKVVGYDRAGNEGNATNVVSYAKNQCS